MRFLDGGSIGGLFDAQNFVVTLDSTTTSLSGTAHGGELIERTARRALCDVLTENGIDKAKGRNVDVKKVFSLGRDRTDDVCLSIRSPLLLGSDSG